jgi:hypothetical protein
LAPQFLRGASSVASSSCGRVPHFSRAFCARSGDVPATARSRKASELFHSPSCDERPLLRNQESAELEDMPKASSSQNRVAAQFESEPQNFYLGVILSGAVFQEQRRISGLPGLTRKPNATTQNDAASLAQTLKPAKLEAKSLSSNILPATLLASIFCADRTRSKTSKSFRTRILAPSRKKNRTRSPARCCAHRLTRTPRNPRATVDIQPRCKMLKQSLIDHLPVPKGFLPWQR